MGLKVTGAHVATFIRFGITPLCMIFLTDFAYKYELLFVIVCIASATDALDGYLSRKYNTTSNFGAFIDFTADKIFTGTLLIILTIAGYVPLWITLIIINREFWVMGIRIFAAQEGFTIASGPWGKWKTTITFMAFGAVSIHFFHPLVYPLFIISVILTIISMIGYTNSFVKYVRESKKTY